MRLITVRAPKGHGQQIAAVAFQNEIQQVSHQEANVLRPNTTSAVQDVIQIETATPKAKQFIETLMASSFYDPTTYSFTVRHPESVFAGDPPEIETYPIVRPTTDVYQDLWQFSQVTVSLLGRVFLSSLLLAYGLLEGYMPLIIAGLLFLPYHHQMLSIAMGSSIKEWKLVKQGLLAFLLNTAAILLAGICVGLLTEPSVKFTEFMSPPLHSFLIAMVIGIAAGLGDSDDAGRRELIGLAATAHVSVYPAWFGLKLIFGFTTSDKAIEQLLIFLMDVSTIILFAGITYKLMKMHGKGIRKYVKRIHQKSKA